MWNDPEQNQKRSHCHVPPSSVVERKTFNLVVVGSIPTVGAFLHPARHRKKNSILQIRALKKSADAKIVRPSGLEPESSPWKGEILPLYYGRYIHARISAVHPSASFPDLRPRIYVEFRPPFLILCRSGPGHTSELAQRKRVGLITQRS